MILENKLEVLANLLKRFDIWWETVDLPLVSLRVYF